MIYFKHLIRKISIMILFILILPVYSQNQFTNSAEFENKINEIFDTLNIQGDFIINVVGESGSVYSFSKTVNLEKQINFDSPIYIASHTKSFTGTLLKILEAEGKLNLKQSINEYLPELTLHDSIDTKSITIVDLLNHTHGIFGLQLTWKTAFLGYEGGNKELLEGLNNEFLYDGTGNFRYSNVGPILAAIIAERATGKNWKDLMSEKIFKPLGMNNTSGYVSSFNNSEIRPAIEISEENKIIQKGFYKDDRTMHASGGIISTGSDLSKWIKANIQKSDKLFTDENNWNELLRETTTQNRKYFSYKREGYNLGWDIVNYHGNKMYSRFGGYASITFHASFMPDKKIGVVAFVNDNRASGLIHLAANYIYNSLCNNSDRDKIFEKEYAIFLKNYKRYNEETPVQAEKPLMISNLKRNIIGTFYNKKGWPDINLINKSGKILMKWGALEGFVYNNKNEKRPFVAALGTLNRSFNVKGDSLFTGSLKYYKK